MVSQELGQRHLILDPVPLADRLVAGVFHQEIVDAVLRGQPPGSDELTGVQALERKHPVLPLAPGHVQRREFEYIRHGTLAFLLSRDVVTGQVLAPHAGPTRTEADFLAHL